MRAFAVEGKQTIKLPRSFLYKTAKNLALDHNRKKTNNLISGIEDGDGFLVIPDEDQASPEEQLWSKQMLFTFAKAVSSLPERSRRVFILAKVHGASYKEISAELGISVSTIEKHVASSIMKCNAKLIEEGFSPEEFGGRRSATQSRTVKKVGKQVGKSFDGE